MSGALPTSRDLLAIPRARDGQRRVLRVGIWSIAFEGLSPELARALDVRWGAFVHPEGSAVATAHVVVAGPPRWVAEPAPGANYPLEGSVDLDRPFVRAHRFAALEEEPGLWRAAIAPEGGEPFDRRLDNLARVLLARLIYRAGGLVLHAAGVSRNKKAWVFAGPSGAGKSTAVRLSPDARSIGDDFAVIVPARSGWVAAAVPFDNAERAPEGAAPSLIPLAGVWRLFQSAEDRVETPTGARAAASLVACVAFPWAVPDLAERIAASAGRAVDELHYAHLSFRPTSDFWRAIDPEV